jgi:hypothetical protein
MRALVAVALASCGGDAPPAVLASKAPPRGPIERAYVSPYGPLPPACDRCVPDPGGACNAHSVSPCTWVLGAPNDPIDLVTSCAASCCPDRASPELCPEFALDLGVTSGLLCPTRLPDGSVIGTIKWRDDVLSVFVLAQARGIETSNSKHSALRAKDGTWKMTDVPAGDVVFSFYAGKLRTRVVCNMPP